MRRVGWTSLAAIASFCLICGCGQKDDYPQDSLRPAMRITVLDCNADGAELKIDAVGASACHLLCLEADTKAPDAQEIRDKGMEVKPGKVKVNGLKDRCQYIAYGVAVSASGQCGMVESAPFATTEGADLLYSWESARTELPSYSNMALCYGGSSHRTPFRWDKDRFNTHVTWMDENGAEHWLFDAFLAIEFVDSGNSMDYAGGYGHNSADKASWIRMLDYWFEKGYGLDALNDAVGDAIGRIGPPSCKRKVVMTMPDAILHRQFKDPSSPTCYWGELNGSHLDFNKASERLAALRWFIDETRRRWDKAGYDNLEFIGFYCVSEDLAVPGYGWSAELKRWKDVYPAISKYIHSCKETISWIPYNRAGGYQLWKDFGFDFAMMQPNYFWHPEYYMVEWMNAVRENGMSMEFELDDAVLEESQGYEAFRSRFDKYISMCSELDLYRKRELSYYMGGNTLYKLAHSQSAKDREFYLKLCRFISDSQH